MENQNKTEKAEAIRPLSEVPADWSLIRKQNAEAKSRGLYIAHIVEHPSLPKAEKKKILQWFVFGLVNAWHIEHEGRPGLKAAREARLNQCRSPEPR